MKRENILNDFIKNTAEHSMEVILDSGLHRHLRFSKGGSAVYHYNITTWPGYLCISGDMGCYVFSRLPDMFEFFRGKPGEINPSYWAEKLQSDAQFKGHMEYSEERLLSAVKYHFDNWVEAEEPSETEKAELWNEIESDVLGASNEYEAHESADRFKYKEEYFFRDFWEHELKDYTFQFIWCLYAIVDAIHKYDNRHVPGEIAKRDARATIESDPEQYAQAVEIVKKSEKAGISHLQRVLKIGYNRAARLIEAMEVEGVVGPLESNGTRKVLR